MTTKPTKASKVATASATPVKAKASKAVTVKAPVVKTVTAKPAKPATVTPVKKVTVKATPPAKVTAKKAPAKPAAPLLRLFQVKVKGQALADPFCEPFTLPASGSLPLIDGMRLLSQDLTLQNSPLWGLLPADFLQRTGLNSTTLGQAIAARPGFDVYFCHAHPELESIYHNPWLQAETTHPNFLVLAREFLKAAGLSDAPLDTLSHSSLFATGHLIVASPAFWVDYLAFIENALSQALVNVGKTARVALFEEETPAGKFSYLYLIVARLLGHFLLAKASAWKACKLTLPQDPTLNPHLRLLREMKDTAVIQQSRWLTACWANYRALYFAQTLGKDWMATHLPAISPKSLKFGPASTGIDYAYPRTTEVASA
jgi:hypothetical protein